MSYAKPRRPGGCHQMKRETRGRKTRLNRALTTRICALLAKGSSIKSACILCNVGERTYFDWQERGKTGEQPYETFFFRSDAREGATQGAINRRCDGSGPQGCASCR